jgi:hypothetical protein
MVYKCVKGFERGTKQPLLQQQQQLNVLPMEDTIVKFLDSKFCSPNIDAHKEASSSHASLTVQERCNNIHTEVEEHSFQLDKKV